MKSDRKIITLVIVAMILFSVLSISLSKFFTNGINLTGDVSGVTQIKRDSVYKDWSELDSIDNDYSYSTIFYTNETEIYVNATSTEQISTYDSTYFKGRTSVPELTFYDSNQKGQIIITNSGVDKDGNKLSAVLDVSIRDVWPNLENDNTTESDEEDRTIARVYPQTFVYTTSQSKPNISQLNNDLARRLPVDYNVPIAFTLDANRATVNIDLTYYKADELVFTSEPSGINATVDKTKSVVATNITKVNSYYTDLDTQPGTMIKYEHAQAVVDNAKATGRDISFDGNEGVRPLNGASTIYYNKNIASLGTDRYTNDLLSDVPVEDWPNVTIRLGTAANGIYLDECNINKSYGYYKNVMNLTDEEIYQRYIFDNNGTKTRKFAMTGAWYPNSTEFLTTGLEGKYSFAYEGFSCGIQFAFFSPQTYNIPDPVKTISKEAAQPGETVYYNIRQYVPNNYVTSIVDFSSIYPDTFSSDKLISKFVIEDSIDKKLNIINEGDNKITITGSDGSNLADHFNMAIDDSANKVTITADDEGNEYFNSPGAYDLFYNVSIPFVYEGSAVPAVEIKNVASSIIKIGNGSDTKRDSNEVDLTIGDKTVKLTYDCTTNGGKAIFDETEVYKIPRTPVELDRVCVKEGHRFVGWVQNAKDTTAMTSFVMPDNDTTIYGIYVPSKCDTVLYSDTYKIDQTNSIVNIPNDDSDATILKRVTSKGEVSLNGTTITVKCDGTSKDYKISRYWVSKTGNDVIKWTAIISGTLLLAVIAVFIKIKTDKKKN